MTWDYEGIERLLDEAIGPVEGPRGRKRMRIMEAAATLFANQGYRKTNVDEIAKAAGVAKGTVYLYFKTKGEIAYAVIALEKKGHLEQMRPAFDPSLPARERLHRIVSSGLVMIASMPVLSKLVSDPREFAAVMLDAPKGVLEQNEAVGLEFYGSLVEEAAPQKISKKSLRDRLQVLRVLGPLARQVSDPTARGHLSAREYARVLADMLVAGLLHPSTNAEEE